MVVIPYRSLIIPRGYTYKITTGELQKAFSKLKSGKSPGLDNVSNEMLKASQSYMNPCLLKLFNAVFTSGIYPSK
jgi:hypothetical protein